MISICSVCARGGSKGVPNKNLTPINGIPLIAHSIVQARESKLFEAVVCSSDSQEILDVAAKYGATLLVKRPSDLALDHSPKIPAIHHCTLETEKYLGSEVDFVLDLDATAPIRDVNHIKEVHHLCQLEGVTNVITGVSARKSPYFNLVEADFSDDAHLIPRLSKSLSSPISRRQDSPKCFDMNASIYAWQRDYLLKTSSLFGPGTRLYEMPEYTAFDIDTELDLEIVSMLMEKYSIGVE